MITVLSLVLVNLTCHYEFSIEQGWCWGPINKQCDYCKNYIYQRQCVPILDNFNTLECKFHNI